MAAWGNSKKPDRDETPYVKWNMELKLLGVVFNEDLYNITDTQFGLYPKEERKRRKNSGMRITKDICGERRP